MITVKSLLSFLVDIDGKKIICFYDQESNDIITASEMTDDEKKQVLQQINKDIYAPIQVVGPVEYAETQDIQQQFDKMKEDYDGRKYEFQDIKL
jgi:hypothetical protein